MIRIFRQYIPKAFLWLAIAEVTVFILAAYAGREFRFSFYGEDYPFFILLHGLPFTLVMAFAMTAVGLYQRRSQNRGAALVVRIITAFLLGFLALSLIFYVIPDLFLGRGAFGFSLIFAFIGITIVRLVFQRVTDQVNLNRRVLVLGAGVNARRIADLDIDTGISQYQIVGYIPTPGDEVSVKDGLLIKDDRPLMELCQRLTVDEVVVAVDNRRMSLPFGELMNCKMNGIDVVDLTTFFEKEVFLMDLDVLHPNWMIYADGFQAGPVKDILKRVFDILACLFLLFISWPFMLITWAAIKWEDGWEAPIFYRQMRVGHMGKNFGVMKFRSMRIDAEGDGKARWAQKNDDRITRVGRIIRLTRLDELPQIFNVLRGDMSFVGPRPERPEFVKDLEAQIPYYAERHRVKPGITGWAQLCYPYGASVEDARRKLEYDLYYVKNYNLFLDLMILLQTAEVILWRKGAQ